jgi:hypothetical protein
MIFLLVFDYDSDALVPRQSRISTAVHNSGDIARSLYQVRWIYCLKSEARHSLVAKSPVIIGTAKDLLKFNTCHELIHLS